jgi:hypothetical protein
MDTLQTYSDQSQQLVGTEVLFHKFQQQPARTMLLHGNSAVFKASLLIGGMLNKPVVVIDGAIRFNSYTLSRIAKILNVPSKDLLKRTYITRSFTAFQTEAAITTKLINFLKRNPCPLVIVLGLLDTYYDEQVKPHECLQSLQRIFQTFNSLVKNNVNILISDVEVENPPKGKEQLYKFLYNSVDMVVSLQSNEHGLQFKEERRIQLWGETTIPSRPLSNEIETRGVNFAEH